MSTQNRGKLKLLKNLQVVFPTPPFPPTNIHRSDFCFRMLSIVGSIGSKSSDFSAMTISSCYLDLCLQMRHNTALQHSIPPSVLASSVSGKQRWTLSITHEIVTKVVNNVTIRRCLCLRLDIMFSAILLELAHLGRSKVTHPFYAVNKQEHCHCVV